MNNADSPLQHLRNSIDDLVRELEIKLNRSPFDFEIVNGLQKAGWESCNEILLNKILKQSNKNKALQAQEDRRL